ncbi:unnamed protein product, partial [Staurois parvus]
HNSQGHCRNSHTLSTRPLSHSYPLIPPPLDPHSATPSSPLSHGPTTALTSSPTPPYIPHTEAPPTLRTFDLTTIEEVSKILSDARLTTCPLDPTSHNSYDLLPPPSYLQSSVPYTPPLTTSSSL